MTTPSRQSAAPLPAAVRIGRIMLWLGGAAAVAQLLVRSRVMLEEAVPWAIWPPQAFEQHLQLAPDAVLLLNLLAIFTWPIVLMGHWMIRRQLPASSLLLWSIGLIAVLIHGHLDAITVGLGWTAGLSLGMCGMILGQYPGGRAAVLAVVAALLLPLAIDGLSDVYIEHPQTVAFYEENRAQIMQQQGWSESSIALQRYEARLYNVDARGYFLTANVYATALLMAIGTAAAWAMMMLRNRKTLDEAGQFGQWQIATVVILALAIVAGMWAMYWTGSKGAWLSAAIGAAVAAALMFSRSTRRSWPMAGVLGMLGVALLGGYFVVGPVTENASLWFRAFYVEAAAKMGAAHPIVGVGPGDFQAHYALVKNPHSPEDVADAHHFIFNTWATLGVMGLAWVAWICAMFYRAIRGMLRPAAYEPSAAEGPAIGFVSMIAAGGMAGFAVEAIVHAPVLMPITAMMLLVQTVAWLIVAVVIARLPWRMMPSGALAMMVAALLAVWIHVQFDMALTRIGAMGLILFWLGAWAGERRIMPEPDRITRRLRQLVLILLIALVTVTTAQVMQSRSQIRNMRQVSAMYHDGQIERAHALAGRDDSARWRAARLVFATQLPPTLQAEHLAEDWQRLFEMIGPRSDETRGRRAMLAAEVAVQRYIQTRHTAWRDRADRAITSASQGSPYSVAKHVKLGDLAWDAALKPLAKQMYRQALENHKRSALEPLAQLTEPQMQRIDRRLGGSGLDGGEQSPTMMD